jgi:hypothetical protein
MSEYSNIAEILAKIEDIVAKYETIEDATDELLALQSEYNG